MLFLLVYIATVMPFRMAFIEYVFLDAWHCVDILVDVLFLVDVFFNSISSYYKKDG